MATKQHNNLPEFESNKFIHWAEQTTSHYEVPNRYWSKDWYRLRPTYKLIFDFLISQAKYKPTDKLAIGQCSFGTIELAKLFYIPRSTVKDILHFLESEGEITLKSTNKFTIVTVNFLSENPSSKTQIPVIKTLKTRHQKTVVSEYDSSAYESEVPKVRHQNSENPSSKHEISDTPIDDNITDIDELDKNEFLSSKNIILNKEEEHKMSSKPKTKEPKAKVKSLFNDISSSVPEPKATKPPTFIDSLLDVWTEEFKLSRNMEYVVIKGKDTAAISKLLSVFKKQKPDLDTPSMLEYFRNFFKQVLAIDDQFIYTNISLAFIYSQINKINTLLLKGSKKQFVSSAGYEAVNPEYQSKF